MSFLNHYVNINTSPCETALSMCGFLEPGQRDLSRETEKGRPPAATKFPTPTRQFMTRVLCWVRCPRSDSAKRVALPLARTDHSSERGPVLTAGLGWTGAGSSRCPVWSVLISGPEDSEPGGGMRRPPRARSGSMLGDEGQCDIRPRGTGAQQLEARGGPMGKGGGNVLELGSSPAPPAPETVVEKDPSLLK